MPFWSCSTHTNLKISSFWFVLSKKKSRIPFLFLLLLYYWNCCSMYYVLLCSLNHMNIFIIVFPICWMIMLIMMIIIIVFFSSNWCNSIWWKPALIAVIPEMYLHSTIHVVAGGSLTTYTRSSEFSELIVVSTVSLINATWLMASFSRSTQFKALILHK